MIRLFLVVIVSLCSFTINAQLKFHGVEIYGGLSNQYDVYDKLASPLFKESYGGNLLIDFKLSQSLFLESGIGYLNNGSQSKFSEEDLDNSSAFKQDIKFIQNYLFVPLNIRFTNIGKHKKIKIATGIYYSYLISLIEKNTGYRIIDGEKVTFDEKNNATELISGVKRHDIGINVDLRRELIGNKYMIVDIGLYGKIGLLPTNTYSEYTRKNYSLGFKLIVRRKKSNSVE